MKKTAEQAAMLGTVRAMWESYKANIVQRARPLSYQAMDPELFDWWTRQDFYCGVQSVLALIQAHAEGARGDLDITEFLQRLHRESRLMLEVPPPGVSGKDA